MKLVLTCEHAGNQVPAEFHYLFDRDPAILGTHRGYDPGAHDLFIYLKDLAAFSRAHMESRLLIELNRSMHHPDLFSEFTRPLPMETRKELINTYYIPYRGEIEDVISRLVQKGEEVIHLSIHSFTPELNGELRNADIGLLYDPSRKDEKDWSMCMKNELLERDGSLRLRANYPYRGTSDGFTTCLRKKFHENYIGIEIEVNQKFAGGNKMDQKLKTIIFSTLEKLLKI